MPTYEYRCASCDHQFELFHSIKEPVRRKCPKCAKLTLKRLVSSGGGVIFKGSGFYATDYRSDSYKKAADAEKPTTPKSDDKKAKTDEKPAKPDDKPAKSSEKPAKSSEKKPKE